MNRRAVTGAAMILGTSASIQIAAAIAHDLFDTLTPAGVSALRFALGAAVILAAVRPAFRGRDRETWPAIAVYGVSMGVLNFTFFESIERLPMGVAVTLAFIAPLGVALAGSRRRRDVAFAAPRRRRRAHPRRRRPARLDRGRRARRRRRLRVGRRRLCGPVGGPAHAPGRRARARHPDRLPRHTAVRHQPRRRTRRPVARLGLVIAVGGLILPFALELEGLRRLEPRLVAVIYSADPAIAAVIGLVALSESLTPPQVVGMAAVIAASAGVTARRDGRGVSQPSARSAAAAASR